MATRIRRSAAPTSAVALIDLAGPLGLELPDAYRDWLLDTNGGVPDRVAFHYRNRKGKPKSARIDWLFPVGRDGLVELTAPDLLAAVEQTPVGLPRGMLPVGDATAEFNTGRLYLMCVGPDAGTVFFRPDVEPTKDDAYPVADTWPGFLAGLMYEDGKPPKAWRQAVWDGDGPALKAILDKGGRWKDDSSTRLDIYREVIAEGSWPLAELLLAYPGFDAMELFEEALSEDRLVLAAQFLDRGRVTEVNAEVLLKGGIGLWHAPPLLSALISRGADVNAEDDDGSTPLHKAVTARGTEAVERLLTAGADPTAKDDDGRTPEKLARRLEETLLAGRLAAAETDWRNRPTPPEPEVAPFDWKGVTFAGAGQPLSLPEVLAFEATHKLKLPAAYRWLLLHSNGGTPNPGLIPRDRMPQLQDEDEDQEGEDQADVRVEFLPLRKGDGGVHGDYPVEEARGWYHDGADIPRGTLPIASLPDYGVDGSAFLLLGLKGRSRGKLIVFDYGQSELVDSLEDLFALLAAAGTRPKSAGERFADAIDAGDPAVALAVLAEGEPIPSATRDGRRPISAAATKGMDDVLVALAGQGHSLDELVHAAAAAARSDLLRRLLTCGRKMSNDTLRVILWTPATYRDPALLAALDARGTKWEKHLKGQVSCLPSAAMSGSVDGLRFMLGKGGTVNHRDDGGFTLLHHAAHSYPDMSAGDPDAAEAMVRFLLDQKATVNRPNAEGHTALHLAVQAGNAGVARLLIDAGEDLHAAHELVPHGMTAEQARKQAEQMSRMAEQMFGQFGKMFTDPDEDDRPVIDTSEPAGEKAAGLLDAMQGMQAAMAGKLPALQEKMAAMAGGSWGKGPSAADLGRRHGRAELAAELAAYQARQRGS